jgi:uncharacterized OsmC-like protein
MSTTSMSSKMMNGVDLMRLHATIKAVRENPALGAFKFRLTNRWTDCGHNRSMVQGFYGAGQEDTSRKVPYVLDNDEPDVLLGTDRAPNPVEYVLHALAGCLTSTLVYYAAAKGIAVESVQTTFEGDIDLRGFLGISDQVRNGYQNIRVTMKVKADCPDAEMDELVMLAQKHSPVFDTVSNPVKVVVRGERG